MQTVAWNLQSKKLNFAHGIWPIYYFSRAVGLWPFSIISNSNGMNLETRFSVYDALWFLISICIFVGAIVLSVQQLYVYLPLQKYGTLSIFGYFAFEIMCLTFGLIAIVFDLFNRNKLIEILQKFSHFDNQVSRVNVPFHDYNLIQFNFFLSFFVWIQIEC